MRATEAKRQAKMCRFPVRGPETFTIYRLGHETAHEDPYNFS